MCLCHPGREFHPGHEPVPSRYATRIGDIDVTVISDGALAIPADILGVNVDPATRNAALRDRLLPDPFDWGLNVVVLRSGGRTVLVDAGIGSENSSATRAGRLALRLEGAGIDPASITDVVATHVHFDHIGGLLDERLRSRMRPDLRIHVSGTDLDFFAAPDFSHNTFGGVQDIIRGSARKFLDAYRSELRPFDKAHEVAPGIVVTRTGGHTPGHSVVRVSSGGNRLTFAGDAVVPLGVEYPEWENAFDHEPADAIGVRVGLLREAAKTGELFIASHLSFPALGRVASAGDSFRYVPVNWAY